MIAPFNHRFSNVIQELVVNIFIKVAQNSYFKVKTKYCIVKLDISTFFIFWNFCPLEDLLILMLADGLYEDFRS